MPKIALSMTQVMNDLAQTGSQVRVVLLDGARPIPPSVASVALPQGLIPLAPAMATSFGLSAEIHDYEAPPKAGDANDAYATGLTASLQQPYADVDTMLRATRLTVHQATAGGQTPWHASASATPPFTFLITSPRANSGGSGRFADHAGRVVEPAGGRGLLVGDLAQHGRRLQGLSRRLRNVGLAGSGRTLRMLLALMSEPNPTCAAAAPAVPVGPVTVIGGVYCPEGYAGYCQPPVGCTGWGCLPPPPPPCVPWHPGCYLPPPPLWCVPWHPGCPGPSCIPWHPGCPGPSCFPWHPGCPICIPWHPGCPGPSCIPWHPGCRR